MQFLKGVIGVGGHAEVDNAVAGAGPAAASAELNSTKFDFIVAGAGAAGSVLAARLSADRGNRVLLIEAGPDVPPGEEPQNVRDPFPGALGSTDFTWPELTVEVFPASGDRPAVRRDLIQAKVMGGGSTINGMMAPRGLPSDFDEWEARGATGWGWHGVLPFFNALETDLDFKGPMHGTHGPIPIRREKREDWPPFATAVTQAMLARGYRYLEDFNAEFGDGVSPLPLNNLPDRRVSAAMGYLDPEARRRPNLNILIDAAANSLLLDGTRVVGVKINRNGETLNLHARETLVCAGAIHTPALLLRSGIGPAAEIRHLGIPVVADLAGVGKNLLNHMMLSVATYLPRRALKDSRSSARSAFTTVLRYSSGHKGCCQGDMHLFPFNRTSWHPLGKRIAAMGLCLYQPFSVGEVRLNGAAPETPPSIRFNMLVDDRDCERLVDGLKLILELLSDPQVAGLRTEVFVADRAAAGRLATRTLTNLVKTTCIVGLFGLASWIRKAALGKNVVDPMKLAADRDAMRAIVRSMSAHVHHVSGTCRMGASDDRFAVVDPQCRVYGVSGLRIADASIMPRIVRAGTHLTSMMIGEKAAAIVLNRKACV